MTAERLHELYSELEQLPLPFESSKEVAGVHLALLDSDIAGFLSRPFCKSSFSKTDLDALKKCQLQLDTLLPHLDGPERKYFGIHGRALAELIPAVEQSLGCC